MQHAASMVVCVVDGDGRGPYRHRQIHACRLVGEWSASHACTHICTHLRLFSSTTLASTSRPTSSMAIIASKSTCGGRSIGRSGCDGCGCQGTRRCMQGRHASWAHGPTGPSHRPALCICHPARIMAHGVAWSLLSERERESRVRPTRSAAPPAPTHPPTHLARRAPPLLLIVAHQVLRQVLARLPAASSSKHRQTQLGALTRQQGGRTTGPLNGWWGCMGAQAKRCAARGERGVGRCGPAAWVVARCWWAMQHGGSEPAGRTHQVVSLPSCARKAAAHARARKALAWA